MILTIYYKSGAKHKVRLTEHFLLTEKGRRCSMSELNSKAKTLADNIASLDYLKHELFLEDDLFGFKNSTKILNNN